MGGALLWPLTAPLALLEQIGLGAGAAIVCLTSLVRLALLPLARRQARGIWLLRGLAPTVGRIIDAFPEPEEQRRRLVALYARHRVSPFGPILLLVPQALVFLGLYHVIATRALGEQPAFGVIGRLSDPVWRQPGAWVFLVAAAVLFDLALLVGHRRLHADAIGWLTRVTLVLLPLGTLLSGYYLPAGLAVYLAASAAFALLQALWFARMTSRPAPVGDDADLTDPSVPLALA